MSFSKIIFSLVMRSPGGSGMVNWQIIRQNALQHDKSCVVNFGAKLSIALTGVRTRVREIPRKTVNLLLLTLYFH